MFRKAATSIVIVAFAAVIVLLSQAPASASAPGSYEAECPPGTFCSIDFVSHGFHDVAYPHPAEVEVVGGFVTDAPVMLTPTLPDGVLDAITDPVVDLSTLPGIPGLPEEPSSGAPETAPPDPAPASADPAPAPPHTDDPDVPAPVPAPVHEDHPDAAGSTGAGQPVDDPVVEPTTTTSTSTTTTTAVVTNQDDDVDEVVAVAADPTTGGDTGEAFDPALAALFGALGALGLFTVGTAAYMIGRRGA